MIPPTPIYEDDLRLPEFRGVPLSELERDPRTGAIVRKAPDDRLLKLVAACGFMPDNFSIAIVCEQAKRADSAEKALLRTYRALCAEQVKLSAQQREASTEGEAVQQEIAKRRCEGITRAIVILTDEAGRAGYVMRA